MSSALDYQETPQGERGGPGTRETDSNAWVVTIDDRGVLPVERDLDTPARPAHMELEIVDTEPGFKGNTAQNATKPAKLSTGAEVQVPLFIEVGTVIKVDTRSGAYLERVSK